MGYRLWLAVAVGVSYSLGAMPGAFAQSPLPPAPPAPVQPVPTQPVPPAAAPSPSRTPGSDASPAAGAAPATEPAPAPEGPAHPVAGSPADASVPSPVVSPSRVPPDPYQTEAATLQPAEPRGANPYRGPSVYPAEQGSGATQPPPCATFDCSEAADRWAPESTAHLTAVRGSPFIQMIGAAFHFRERISSAAAFGGEAGLFAFDRLRVSARALIPASGVNDEINDMADTSDAYAWLWGVSVGAAANRQAGFALSPSLQYLRPQGGDYGNMLGVHVPFEWLSDSGFRLGFDFSLLYGFGGRYRQVDCLARAQCPVVGSAQRPSSAGFVAGFMIGHAFSVPGQES